MVEQQLRGRGIRSEAVLEVMGKVPRERFLAPGPAAPGLPGPWPFPSAHGQTVSQPYMVAVMTEALSLRPTDRVLEIGTGSGYQTAVLSASGRGGLLRGDGSRICPQAADSVLGELGCENVRLKVGDGTLGWPEEGPFDAILVTAGAPRVPESLKGQLADEGGRLVVPVGDRFIQELVRVTRNGERVRQPRSFSPAGSCPCWGRRGGEALEVGSPQAPPYPTT